MALGQKVTGKILHGSISVSKIFMHLVLMAWWWFLDLQNLPSKLMLKNAAL